jgi:hypothetical protein
MASLEGRDAGAPASDRRKAVKILARSLFRDMIRHQYDPQHVIAFASELIDLLTHECARARNPA